MSDTNDKLRALFLVALMVLSVFGTTVVLTGVSAANHAGNAGALHVDDDRAQNSNAEFTSIQAAVDSAPGGSTIIVHNGTYNEQIVINKSLTLIGDPGSGVGPGPDAPVLDGQNNVGSAITIEGGVSDVIIEGFEVTGYLNSGSSGGVGSGVLAWNSTAINNVTVRNNYFHDLGWNAVLVGNEGQALHNGWTVSNNLVEDVAFYSIELTNTQNSVVSENEIVGGPDVQYTSTDTEDSDDGILIQAQIHTGSGLMVRNVEVSNNTLSGTFARAGVELLAWDSNNSRTAHLDGVDVVNNQISGAERGLFVYPVGTNANISNVDVLDNGFSNNVVQIEDNQGFDTEAILFGNTFDKAVAVDRPGDSLLPTVWSSIQDGVNNSQPGDTVFVGGSGEPSVTDGVYVEDVVTQPTGDDGAVYIGKNDLTLTGFGDPVLEGDNQAGSGIVLDSVSNVTIQGFEIRNYDNPTDITDPNDSGSGGIGSGILSWNSMTDNITVRNNHIRDVEWDGVLVGSDDGTVQSDWMVTENLVENAAYGGIELTNTENSVLSGNDVFVGPGIAWDPADSGVGIEVATRDFGGDGIVAEDNDVVDNFVTEGSNAGDNAPVRAGVNILSRSYVGTGGATLEVRTSSNEVIGVDIGVMMTSESRNSAPAELESLVLNSTLNNSVNAKAQEAGDTTNTSMYAIVFFNDLLGDGADVVNAASMDGPLPALLNWYGDDRAEGSEFSGDVLYDPFLTAPKDDVDKLDENNYVVTRQFAHDFEFQDDGKVYAMAFAGPSERSLADTLPTGANAVYRFDNVNGQWELAGTDFDPTTYEPDALDVVVVVPNASEESRAVVEYENTRPATVSPGESQVSSGWALVGASEHAGIESGMVASSNPDRAIQVFAVPESQPRAQPTDFDDPPSAHTFSTGDEFEATPHTGYWVFMENSGVVAANTWEGMTWTEYRELINASG